MTTTIIEDPDIVLISTVMDPIQKIRIRKERICGRRKRRITIVIRIHTLRIIRAWVPINQKTSCVCLINGCGSFRSLSQ